MKSNRTQHGQALIEFALVAVLLLTLLMGGVDFALAYSSQVALRNAVAEGGYYAMQHPRDEPGIRGQVESELAQRTFLEEVSVTINQCIDDAVGSKETTIEATYHHNLLFSYLVPSMQVTLRSRTVVPQLGC
ncbi:MAG TPA: TadE/TadG family type IV pilus assembly protein [Kouleothrix sp.]|uniref:TadE/TadG family type IV pilus assembly protein n=1 Tax=Kouleothrix sp. TaxID=2779161 RepID=UPI002C1BC2DB|nr:TadE/TadG family type IV pilus assembly protein [Kouleothrix sp.]